MGNFVSKRYELVRDIAVGAYRFVCKDKEKEVIDVDDEIWKVGFERKDAVGEHRFVNKDKGNEVLDVENGGLKGLVVSHDDGVCGGIDVHKVEVYKKKLETLERRGGKSKSLGFQIQLCQRKLSAIQAFRGWTKPKEDVVEEIPYGPFNPLTEEEVSEVKCAFSANNKRRILVTHENSNIDITGERLQCLRLRAWLNDEVINVYLELLKEREKREPKQFLKCHFFNTFFYKKLTNGGKDIYDYNAVRRWTTERKLGYFLVECDKIFVPIHRENHWCLAIINKKDQKFQYLDSFKGQDYWVLENLVCIRISLIYIEELLCWKDPYEEKIWSCTYFRNDAGGRYYLVILHQARYYVDEVKDKNKKDIDVSSWEHEIVEDLPEQKNGYDCGVFMVKYADFYSRGLRLYFRQEDMHYFRMRTAKEILRLRAD